jgi:hypothetical protein
MSGQSAEIGLEVFCAVMLLISVYSRRPSRAQTMAPEKLSRMRRGSFGLIGFMVLIAVRIATHTY